MNAELPDSGRSGQLRHSFLSPQYIRKIVLNSVHRGVVRIREQSFDRTPSSDESVKWLEFPGRHPATIQTAIFIKANQALRLAEQRNADQISPYVGDLENKSQETVLELFVGVDVQHQIVADTSADFSRPLFDELRECRRRAYCSRLYAAKRGEWKGGAPPFGYKLVPLRKTLEFEERERNIVRFIFERVSEGISVADVAWELRAMSAYGRPRKGRILPDSEVF